MYKRTSLAGGVNLTGVYSGKHKTNLLLVSFLLDLNPLNATSLNLLSKVLLRGTSSYPDLASFSRACDDNYALGLDAFTIKKGEGISLVFSLSTLKNKYALDGEDIFARGLEIFSELIFSPYLPGGTFYVDYVNREKEALKEQILSLINNKPAYAMRQAINLMCQNEAYAVPSYGDIETLEGLDNTKLTEIYNSVISTAPVEIVFCGEYDIDYVNHMLAQNLPFTQRDYSLPKVYRPEKPSKVKTFTEKADATQSNLVMGFRTGEYLTGKAYSAYTIFNEIFSQSPVSKLFMNVREKKSLCYYCSAHADRLKGVMAVTAGINASAFEKAKKEIIIQLEDMKRGKITENEFKSAITSAVSACRELDDNPAQVCSYYLSRLINGEIITPEDEIKSINSLTPDDIIQVAKEITLDTVFLLEGNS
jgi:predicted Zn-dependent peptidase